MTLATCFPEIFVIVWKLKNPISHIVSHLTESLEISSDYKRHSSWTSFSGFSVPFHWNYNDIKTANLWKLNADANMRIQIAIEK